MLVNLYSIRKSKLVLEKDIGNYLHRLSKLTDVVWKTIHVPDLITSKGKNSYTCIRSIAHYDISKAIETLEARCKDPFKQANHKKVWLANINKFKAMEEWHATNNPGL